MNDLHRKYGNETVTEHCRDMITCNPLTTLWQVPKDSVVIPQKHGNIRYS
jgi:hypothetical protein